MPYALSTSCTSDVLLVVSFVLLLMLMHVHILQAFDLMELRYVACKIHQLNQSWSDEHKMSYTKVRCDGWQQCRMSWTRGEGKG